GVRLTYKGHKVVAGKLGLLSERIEKEDKKIKGSVVEVAVDDDYIGYVELQDKVRASSKTMVEGLKAFGVKTLLLSGDRVETVEDTAKNLGLDEWHGALLPEEKTKLLQENIEKKTGAIAYVGDGINDAPSIALADVGIAMGGFGSDMAIQNADIVLMDDDPNKVVTAKKIARATERRAVFNIAVALFSKLVAMVLSLLWSGFPLWLAVVLDSGMAVILTLNSLALFAKRVK
ncbi:MAG: HAD-IC family P-type ATPase, partial [Bacilli bacterium]|nr:HAD-IC family P-type ATPase [Bacilli bacterium]